MFDVFSLSHFCIAVADNVNKNDKNGDEDDVETCFHNPFSRLGIS